MAVNPRLAYAIGRPDHAIGYRSAQVGGARASMSNSVVHGGGIGRGAGGEGMSSTVNISLGISAVLVAVLVGLYIWADKGSK